MPAKNGRKPRHAPACSGQQTIASLFAAEHASRSGVLNAARECARLTKPWLLPLEGQDANSPLPQNFQSDGARIITNLEGKMMTALFPPGHPNAMLVLSPKIQYDRGVSDAIKEQLADKLFWYEVMVQALMESSDPYEASNRQPIGYHTVNRSILSNFLVIGDALGQTTDDYRLRNHRFDHYVTRRNKNTDVLFHVIQEEVDPLTLTPEQVVQLELDEATLADSPVVSRVRPMYTKAEWHPLSRVWVIEQEVDGKIINTSEDEVSPYFSVTGELIAGHHYGRGFTEHNRGDLWALDEHCARLNDFAESASKHLWFKDHGSHVKDEHLARASGSTVRARVVGGELQDVCISKTEKGADFNVVFQNMQAVRERLGANGMMTSAAAPRGDRVTAFAWDQVRQEVDGALGGFFTPVAEQLQVPQQKRTLYQATRDRLIPAFPKGAVEVRAITGLAALARRTKATNVLTFAQAAAELGVNVMSWIKEDKLVAVLARYTDMDEPGLIRTPKEMAQLREQQAKEALAMQAGAKAVDTVGNIAEDNAAAANKAKLKLTA